MSGVAAGLNSCQTGGSAAAVYEHIGQRFSFRRICRRLHSACQNHIAVDDLDPDVRVFDIAREIGLQPGYIAINLQVQIGDLFAILAENENIRIADILAKQVNAACRARDCVSDIRIGDQNVISVGRKLKHHRLVEAKRDFLRPRAALCQLDNISIVVGMSRGQANRGGRQ